MKRKTLQKMRKHYIGNDAPSVQALRKHVEKQRWVTNGEVRQIIASDTRKDITRGRGFHRKHRFAHTSNRWHLPVNISVFPSHV